MFGIVEVITLLLGLSGVGLQPNPRPATPDAALQYAIPDADVVVHIDAASIIPGNYKILSNLGNQPQVKASPELSKAVREIVNQVEGGRGLVKSGSGIDLATDVSDATLFLQIVPQQHDPNFVVAVHGRFSTANIDKIAATVHKQSAKVGSGVILEMGAQDPAIAVTKDGVFLAGTAKLLRDRLADTWKAPARAANSNLAQSAEIIGAHPVFAVVMHMTPAARKQALGQLKAQNFLSDILTRHKLAAFSMFHDGIGWTWIDSTKPGLESMSMVSDGMLDLLKAANIAPRGFAKVMLGSIDSYKGSSKQIDEVIRHKAELMKIVETYTGDGNFKTAVNKDAARLRLTVRATGKSLSDVMPAGALLPLGVIGMFDMRKQETTMPAPTAVRQAPPAPRPLPPTPVKQKPVQPPSRP